VPALYTPALWLAIALALLALRRRDRTAVLMLAAGIGFAAALCITTPDHALPLYAFALLVLLRGRA